MISLSAAKWRRRLLLVMLGKHGWRCWRCHALLYVTGWWYRGDEPLIFNAAVITAVMASNIRAWVNERAK